MTAFGGLLFIFGAFGIGAAVLMLIGMEQGGVTPSMGIIAANNIILSISQTMCITGAVFAGCGVIADRIKKLRLPPMVGEQGPEIFGRGPQNPAA